MSLQRLLMTLAAVLALAGAAGAADLNKVERVLKKEPAYQNKPKYCLLVFGPEATSRVWLVQDGDALYVDRNGNGDLTEEGERVAVKEPGKEHAVFEAGDLRDGALTHKGLVVTCGPATADYVGPREWKRLQAAGSSKIWTVRVSAERPADDTRKLPKHLGYIANGDGLGFLLFADKAQDAPVISFNGPWTLGLQDVKQHLVLGQKSNLQIGVGTQGVGPGTFSFLLYPNTVPDDAFSTAEVVFPPKSPGGTEVRQKFTLTKRC